MQGVGFRPHVHRLATDLGLVGYVLNDASGVLLEVQADPRAGRALPGAPRRRGPAPRADRARSSPTEIAPTDDTGFAILPSAAGGEPSAAVAPDAATCADCLAEMRDPADRRYRYPFITCTACGPRYTIVTGVPYDRARTTMAGFAMCDPCRAEYEDPADRRFHAEPIACPDCGPRLRLAGLPIEPAASLNWRTRRRPHRDRRRRASRGPHRRREGHRGLPPGLPGRRRGRGRAAAGPQAAGGEALRGDGARPRRGPAPGRSRAGGGGASSPGASGRSCSRAAARTPRSPRRSPRAPPTSG